VRARDRPTTFEVRHLVLERRGLDITEPGTNTDGQVAFADGLVVHTHAPPIDM
jgi:hypothetical protein